MSLTMSGVMNGMVRGNQSGSGRVSRKNLMTPMMMG